MFPERSDWCPSNILNEIILYWLSELDDPVVEYEVSKLITDTFIAIVNEVCLEELSLLQH